MPTKKATIIKTKHKGNDVFALDLGTTRKEKRYTREHSAAVAAVRANKDWCGKNCFDNVVKITYPDGRTRLGGYWSDGSVHLGEFKAAKKGKA